MSSAPICRLSRVGAVMVKSDFHLGQVAEACPGVAERLRVVPNGVDGAEIREIQGAVQAEAAEVRIDVVPLNVAAACGAVCEGAPCVGPAAQAGLCHGYLPLLLVRSDMTPGHDGPCQFTRAPRSGALWCGQLVAKRGKLARLPACLTGAEGDVSTENDRI